MIAQSPGSRRPGSPGLATIDYAENGNDITDGTESGFSANVLAELTSDESDWLGEGVEFSFDGPDVPNQEPNAVALEDAANTEAYVLASPPESDDDDGELYVVVDTEDGFVQDVDDGDEFTVTLAYEGSEHWYQFDGESGSLGGADGDADAPPTRTFLGANGERHDDPYVRTGVDHVRPDGRRPRRPPHGFGRERVGND
ncbi:hypothetical protein D8S78_10575 [Natrialba swarupiae]|nr:hypothetical protein [Natrialba swarupiae]